MNTLKHKTHISSENSSINFDFISKIVEIVSKIMFATVDF
jgi:hypothetical protein